MNNNSFHNIYLAIQCILLKTQIRDIHTEKRTPLMTKEDSCYICLEECSDILSLQDKKCSCIVFVHEKCWEEYVSIHSIPKCLLCQKKDYMYLEKRLEKFTLNDLKSLYPFMRILFPTNTTEDDMEFMVELQDAIQKEIERRKTIKRPWYAKIVECFIPRT